MMNNLIHNDDDDRTDKVIVMVACIQRRASSTPPLTRRTVALETAPECGAAPGVVGAALAAFAAVTDRDCRAERVW